LGKEVTEKLRRNPRENSDKRKNQVINAGDFQGKYALEKRKLTFPGRGTNISPSTGEGGKKILTAKM